MVRRPVTADAGVVAQFGRFRLNSRRRELLADGVPIAIGGRALDILIILVEGRGELVTRDELMDGVWPGMIVELNTLQFQICSLRKALGPDRDFVKTISGRGYRFVAETTILDRRSLRTHLLRQSHSGVLTYYLQRTFRRRYLIWLAARLWSRNLWMLSPHIDWLRWSVPGASARRD